MIMSMPKPRVTAVILLVLFLALFREAPRTAANLTITWGRVLASGDLVPLLRQADMPGAGEHVLPAPAKYAISLVGILLNLLSKLRWPKAFNHAAVLQQRNR